MRKFLRTALGVMVLGLIGVVSSIADEPTPAATITFSTNSSDGSTAVTTSTLKNQISAGANYVSSVKSTANCYPGASGLKLSSSSKAGSFELALTGDANTVASKVVVNTVQYGTDNIGYKITLGDGTNTQAFTFTEVGDAACTVSSLSLVL